ncbi:MAG: tetratricopeptide repeat protein [bacterium]|nr:tetratricopeptide repeat protein [bacterium]
MIAKKWLMIGFAVLALSLLPRTFAHHPTPLFIQLLAEDSAETLPTGFLDRVTQRLEAVELTPVFITEENSEQHGQFWHQPSLILSSETTGEEIVISVRPFATLRLPISSALAASPTAPVEVNIYAEVERDSSAFTLMTAMGLYVSHRCSEALPLFDALAQDADVTNPTLDFYRATCLLIDGELEAARALYERQPPANAESWVEYVPFALNLAWIDLQEGNPEESFQRLETVLNQLEDEDSPARMALLSGRARLYSLNFQYDAAIADMDAAVALEPENPELYVLRGQMVMLLYEWDRVLENYNTALELDPHYADAYYFRGILYYSVLERETALADFEHYLTLVPAGGYSDEARHYAESIRAELEAVGEGD